MTYDPREAQQEREREREDQLKAELRVMGHGLTAPGLSDSDRAHI